MRTQTRIVGVGVHLVPGLAHDRHHLGRTARCGPRGRFIVTTRTCPRRSTRQCGASRTPPLVELPARGLPGTITRSTLWPWRLNIADLFEHAVDAVPDRVAVACGDRAVTFAELEERANRLAHHLAEQRRRPGRPRRASTHATRSRRSRPCSRRTSCARSPSTSTTGTSRTSCATCSTTPTWSRSCTTASSPRGSPPCCPTLPKLRTVVVDRRRQRRRLRAHGGVDYEDGARRGVARARLRAAQPGRPLHPLHRRHHRLPQGRDVAARGRLARARRRHRLHDRRSRCADEWAQSRARPARSAAWSGSACAPLIHGAAQWAALAALFAGDTVVLLPQFDPHEVWRAVERHKVNVDRDHRRRDGPAADRGVPRGRLRRLVAVRHLQQRRAVLARR